MRGPFFTKSAIVSVSCNFDWKSKNIVRCISTKTRSIFSSNTAMGIHGRKRGLLLAQGSIYLAARLIGPLKALKFRATSQHFHFEEAFCVEPGAEGLSW